MRDLVREDPGQLRDVARLCHHSTREIDIAATDREGVELVALEYVEAVEEGLGLGDADNPLSDLVHVREQDGIGHELRLCANLAVDLRGHLHLAIDAHLSAERCALQGVKRAPAARQRCAQERGQEAPQAQLSGSAGVQRRRGRRAARTSSRRRTFGRCGAPVTCSGVVAASSAMRSIASTNASSDSRDSHSVGSIIRAPWTTSGK